MELELDWVRQARVNRSAVERRAATLGTRRSVKKAWQAAWLLRAVQCIDLTTLAGDDTPGRVRRLCAKARRPVRADLLEGLGLPSDEAPRITVAAVGVSLLAYLTGAVTFPRSSPMIFWFIATRTVS